MTRVAQDKKHSNLIAGPRKYKANGLARSKESIAARTADNSLSFLETHALEPGETSAGKGAGRRAARGHLPWGCGP